MVVDGRVDGLGVRQKKEWPHLKWTKAYDSPDNMQLEQHHPKKDGEHSYGEANSEQSQLNDDSYARQLHFCWGVCEHED